MTHISRSAACKKRRPGSGANIIVTALLVVASQAVSLPAFSQYMYDPSAPDELTPGIRYFGSAKDDKGVLLAGVTVLIDVKGQSEFVFITDEQGRFRGRLPLSLVGTARNLISSSCAKAGYRYVGTTRRYGMTAPAPYLQIDCVLRPSLRR